MASYQARGGHVAFGPVMGHLSVGHLSVPTAMPRTDYSCAVEAKILLHGRLYVTDKFVCFYSNFFGFEKKVAPACLLQPGAAGSPEPPPPPPRPADTTSVAELSVWFVFQIKIPYNHVLKVTKGNTALLIPNGINVVTTRKEYTFRSFWDR